MAAQPISVDSVTLSIKMLNGDLIQVNVRTDYRKHETERYPILLDLLSIMSDLDPVAYPIDRSVYTRVPKEQTDEKEAHASPMKTDERIEDEDILLLVVHPHTLCKLVSHGETHVVRRGMNSIRATYYHFRTSTNHSFYLFRNATGRYMAVYGELEQIDDTHSIPASIESRHECYWENIHPFWLIAYYGRIRLDDQTNTYRDIITAYDAYAIQRVLEHFEAEHMASLTKTLVYSGENREVSYLCECGHVVSHKRTKAHLATKKKHADGHPVGREIIQMVNEYIQTL